MLQANRCAILLLTALILWMGGITAALAQSWSPFTTIDGSTVTARHENGAVEYNGYIYVFGGRPSSNPPSATAHVYDPASDTWSAIADMATARMQPASAIWNGRIYAIGGLSGGRAHTSVEVYDPATATWTTASNDLPTGRMGFYVASANNRLYAFGGSNRGFPMNAHDTVYELALESVSTAIEAWDWGAIKALMVR